MDCMRDASCGHAHCGEQRLNANGECSCSLALGLLLTSYTRIIVQAKLDSGMSCTSCTDLAAALNRPITQHTLPPANSVFSHVTFNPRRCESIEMTESERAERELYLQDPASQGYCNALRNWNYMGNGLEGPPVESKLCKHPIVQSSWATFSPVSRIRLSVFDSIGLVPLVFCQTSLTRTVVLFGTSIALGSTSKPILIGVEFCPRSHFSQLGQVSISQGC